MSDNRPLAHSAPVDNPGRPQYYCDHSSAVREGASKRAAVMLRYAKPDTASFLKNVVAGAAGIHDLGKLTEGNQAALRAGRGHALPDDHVDAGVAYALDSGNKSEMAAWLVLAHHSPGLPSLPNELANGFRDSGPPPPPYLRGLRTRDADSARHWRLIEQTNRNLPNYLEQHRAQAGEPSLKEGRALHGLPMRLALSCLVDADHSDTAYHDTGQFSQEPPACRWAERIHALDRYVRSLPRGALARDRQRQLLYDACAAASMDSVIVSCQAAVGLGKTTAVTRYLLAQAQKLNLRHLFVVAPFTNIIRQTVQRLRSAVVLEGEDPRAVVAEHHHKAEWGSIDLRHLAVLWESPIIVTTAVQFFETLAASDPATLRKLHQLPGSGVFIDEVHAAMPVHLWPQNWRWLQELCNDWSCRFVLASGSLVQFWAEERVISPACVLPDLTPSELVQETIQSERRRVLVKRIKDESLTREELVDCVFRACSEAGPVLLILNTVQSAAVIARDLAQRLDGIPLERHPHKKSLRSRRVLHLSTALCPRDREGILQEIERRQQSRDANWVLVATSCVEAGVDLDFQIGFRERSSVASFIQTGGRIDRHGKRGNGSLYDFTVRTDREGLLREHPAFKYSRQVFDEMWHEVAGSGSTGQLATRAMVREIERTGGFHEELTRAESNADYPEVARLGKVIKADTRTVIIDDDLIDMIKRRQPVPSRAILEGSVQIWATKISEFGRELSPGIYVWELDYDPQFLGIMAGVLKRIELVRCGVI